MAMSWRVEMLGGLRVQRLQEQRDERAIPVLDRFRSRQAGALLAFLAYFPRSHAREELTELLWPGHDATLGRNHLRVVLLSLRRDLEPPGVPPGSVLETDRSFVRLSQDVVTTDVAEFEAALKGAVQAANRSAANTFLARVVELYRGVLLPGFYEEWIVPEAQRLEEEFFVALRRLVAGVERDGDGEGALHLARRGASVNPLREDVARDLMRLYAQTGQPSQARRQYHELEGALRRALHTSPGPQTRELLRHIESEALQGQQPHGAPQTSSNTRPSGATQPAQGQRVEPQTSSNTPAFVVAANAEQGSPVGAPANCAGKEAAPGPVSGEGEARLPAQWTRFFGRESEMESVRQRLQNGARLVTLSGTGGSGKTRLALEIAQRIAIAQERDAERREKERGALWFVPLADVFDARLIAGEIESALRLPRSPVTTPMVQVMQTLATHREPLVVLDNFEQLLPEGAALVQELLAHVPALSLIVTSRQELGIAGEEAFHVPPLEVPEVQLWPASFSPASLLRFASVQLFHDRARAARPDFRLTKHNASAIARLCARLEGLPLAIELCAARAGEMSPSQMLARLEKQRLDFLTEPSPSSTYRHPTLRAALEWSYALLWPELQGFFVQLSAFRGGFTPHAAALVAGQPHAAHFLEQLRAASLVVREDGPGGARFRLLETVREFTGERLDGAQNHDLEWRHAQFYQQLAQNEYRHVMATQADCRLDSMARMASEHDNLRSALWWSVKHEPELALHLVHLISPFWGAAGLEAHEVAECALQKAPDAPPGLVSAVLGVAATQAHRRGDYERQRILSQRRLELMRAQNNELDAAWALFHLGCAFEGEGNFKAASEHFGQALGSFRAWQHEGEGARQNVAWTLDKLGECASWSGDLDAATLYFQECAAVFRSNDDRDGVASALSQLGNVARQRGDFPLARRLFRESDNLQQELGDTRAHPWRAFYHAHLCWDEGDFENARTSFERALRAFAETGVLAGMLRCLWALGCIAMAQGEAKRAGFLLGGEEATRQERRCAPLPECFAALERALRQARSELKDEFEAAFVRGRAAAVEDVVAWALRRED
jgi:predicted ATPase/DNA-binding SARP family transcriptional activator/tetratricopeptide (TPR) repeat protein